ncbi:TIGR03089 family protein [Mobilicoccus pelagius]|nr:TIGR03089 family protein [Mobilicoccus pelagius]
MTRPDDLARILRSGESALPRLIWHAPGERIELSGRVLATWTAKAADLLQEDLDGGVGTRVRLEGDPHWRLLVWALATWTVGGTVVVGGGAPSAENPVDVVVIDGERLGETWEPGAAETQGADWVVALTRAALARRSPVPLPAGVVDEAAVLLSHPDEMDPYDTAPATAPALVGDAASVTYDDLVTPGVEGRLHVSGTAPLAEVLRTAASAWAGGGSILLTDPRWEEEHGGDPTQGSFARILESEGVTGPAA